MAPKNVKVPESLRRVMGNLALSYMTPVRDKAMDDLKKFFEQKDLPNTGNRIVSLFKSSNRRKLY